MFIVNKKSLTAATSLIILPRVTKHMKKSYKIRLTIDKLL